MEREKQFVNIASYTKNDIDNALEMESNVSNIDGYEREYYRPLSSLPFLHPEQLYSSDFSRETSNVSHHSDWAPDTCYTNSALLFSYDEQQMICNNALSDSTGNVIPDMTFSVEGYCPSVVSRYISPSIAYYRYRLLHCLLHVSREGEYVVNDTANVNIHNSYDRGMIRERQNVKENTFRRTRPAMGRSSHPVPLLSKLEERTALDVLDDVWSKHQLNSRDIYSERRTAYVRREDTIYCDYSVERYGGRIDDAEFMEALCTSFDLFMRRRADIVASRDGVSQSTDIVNIVSNDGDNSASHICADQTTSVLSETNRSGVNFSLGSSGAAARQKLLANPLENVMNLPAPNGAIVFGPIRGHACDFATNLLRYWLYYPDIKGYGSYDVTLVDGKESDDGNKGPSTSSLENVSGTNRTAATARSSTIEQKIRLFFKRFINGVYFDDSDKTELFKIRDLVLLGSIIDGGQESVEILTIICWLSLVLMAHPQYHINPNISNPNDIRSRTSPFTSMAQYTLRDRLAIVKGSHELLFPITMMCTGSYIGRLDHELNIRYKMRETEGSPSSSSQPASPSHIGNNSSDPMCFRVVQSDHLHRTVEKLVYALFEEWPVAAVVQGKYFCVSGGIPSSMPTISAINNNMNRRVGGDEEGEDFVKLCELVFSDPMDDDDERRLPPLTMFANNCERGLSHNYSFNATCRFLKVNNLLCMFRANSYVSHRLSGACSATGRPWHFKYSPRDLGYRIHRLNPNTGMPSIVSLFSVSQFASQNHNCGAIAIIPPCYVPCTVSEPQGKDGEANFSTSIGVGITNVGSNHTVQMSTKQNTTAQFIKIQELNVAPNRPLQLPGTASNAFAWSFPLVVHALRSAVATMIYNTETDELPAKKESMSSSYRDTVVSTDVTNMQSNDLERTENQPHSLLHTEEIINTCSNRDMTPMITHTSDGNDKQMARKMMLSIIDKESHSDLSTTYASYLFRRTNININEDLIDEDKSERNFSFQLSPVLPSISEIHDDRIEKQVESSVAKYYRLLMLLREEGQMDFFRSILFNSPSVPDKGNTMVSSVD